MKNLIKLVTTLLVALFLVSIVATFSHAQTKYTTFQCFVLTYGGDFTFEGNTKAIGYYNEVNHTYYSTFDELYNSNDQIVKEFTVICDKVNSVNYSIDSTPQEVEKQIIKVDSLQSYDIIHTDVIPTNNYSIIAPVLVEDGDILSETKKAFKNHDTYIYNETKNMMIPVDLIPDPSLVVEIKSPNKKLYFVYNPQLDIAKYEKKVNNLKGNWHMKTSGKELGSTPKRTDVKRSIFGIKKVRTCDGDTVWFGLIVVPNQ